MHDIVMYEGKLAKIILNASMNKFTIKNFEYKMFLYITLIRKKRKERDRKCKKETK